MLQNVSVRYDPVEDRLLMRFRMSEGEQVRDHWLQVTRRVYARWRNDLQQMLDMSAELPPRMDRTARAVVSTAHHRAVASQVPVRAEKPTETPPPAAAALVTAIECGRRRTDRRWVLKFLVRERAPLTLVLGDRTLHALIEAVVRRVRAAGWGLAPLPLEAAEGPGSAAGSPKPPLH